MNKSLHAPLIQIALAIVALLIGVFVYLLDRRAENVYFIPLWLANTVTGNSFLGALSNYLPTFVHVYAFILLTMAIVVPLEQYRRYLIPVCVIWFLIDALFEVAQMAAFAEVIAAHTPGWFEGVPFLENTANYFLSSTFDILDLVSIGLGTLAAYYSVAIIDNLYVEDETVMKNQ